MAEGAEHPNVIAKYGSLAGMTVLGTAVAATYAYSYTNLSKLKKEQSDLMEKVLRFIEEGEDQKVIKDMLERMQGSTDKLEKTIASLQISMKEAMSRIRLVEEFMEQMGFDIPGERGYPGDRQHQRRRPYPRGRDGPERPYDGYEREREDSYDQRRERDDPRYDDGPYDQRRERDDPRYDGGPYDPYHRRPK